MRKLLTAFALVLLSVSSSYSQNADLNIAYIIREAPNSEILKDSIGSMARGIIAANSYSENIGKKIYCQPALNITPDQYIDIMAELTKKKPYLLNESAGVTAEVLLLALIEKFPCH